MIKKLAGHALAAWLRTVHRTTAFVDEPADLYEGARDCSPFIVAMWHGDAFMAPFMQREGHKFAVMVSRHKDGDVIATALESLGTTTIRGAGGKPKDQHRKGGVQALRQMVETLKGGLSVGMTADVPKVSRKAGPGIIALARLSGRPIIPVAVATSRMWRLNTWDRTAICLPFARGAFVVGPAIWVEPKADAAMQEAARLQVEQGLNEIHARAAVLANAPR